MRSGTIWNLRFSRLQQFLNSSSRPVLIRFFSTWLWSFENQMIDSDFQSCDRIWNIPTSFAFIHTNIFTQTKQLYPLLHRVAVGTSKNQSACWVRTGLTARGSSSQATKQAGPAPSLARSLALASRSALRASNKFLQWNEILQFALLRGLFRVCVFTLPQNKLGRSAADGISSSLGFKSNSFSLFSLLFFFFLPLLGSESAEFKRSINNLRRSSGAVSGPGSFRRWIYHRLPASWLW